MLKRITLAAILAVLTSSLLPAIPSQINYRGKLFESGNPVTGLRSMEFRIYDALTGGIQLWTSGAVNIDVSQGLYNYTLGTNPVIPGSIFTNVMLHLEVRVAGTPLVPRERFVTVPYAFNSDMVDGKHAAETGPWKISGSDIFYNAGKVTVGANTAFDEFSVVGTFSVWDGGGSPLIQAVPGGGGTISMGDLYGDGFGTRLIVDGGGNGNAYFLNGNVGIGTTTPAGLLSLGSSLANNKFLLYDSDFSTGDADGFAQLAAEMRMFGDFGADITFGFLDGTGSFNERLRFKNSGNVGIGTNNPAAKMDINYNLAGNPGQTPGLIIRNNAGADTGQAEIRLDPAGVGSNWTISANDESTKFRIYRGAAPDFLIDAAGNVGIGTANPLSILSMDAEGLIATPRGNRSILLTKDGGDVFLETASSDMSEGVIMRGSGVDSGLVRNIASSGYAFGWAPGLHLYNNANEPIIFRTSALERMRILGTGNVGIGTTGPSQALDVFPGTTGKGARFGTAAVGDWSAFGVSPNFAVFAHTSFVGSLGYALLQDSTGNTMLNAASGQNIYFRINNGNNMIVDSTGKIGMGTITPYEKMQIGDRWTFHDGGPKAISYNAYWAGASWKYLFNIGAMQYYIDSGNYCLNYAPVGLPAADITWQSRFFVQGTTGNIGIGTTSPTTADALARTVQIGTRTVLQDTVGYQTTIANNVHYDGVSWKYVVNAFASAIRLSGLGDTGDITFTTSPAGIAGNTIPNFDNTDVRMAIKNNGNIGIGTTGPSYKLDVFGDLRITGTPYRTGGDIAWQIPSDVRLKNISRPYQYGLAEVMLLNPVNYNYKKNSQFSFDTNREYMGLVAQEVQKVIPEAVSVGQEGYLNLNTTPIFWAMLNSIKELKNENDELKAKNDELEERLARVEKILGMK